MKKLLILVSILMVGFVAKSQYPVTQNLGSDSTLVTSRGGLKGRLINWMYSDTSAANLTRIKDYVGAQIYTTLDSGFWLRGGDFWARIGGTNGGPSGSFWAIGGNDFFYIKNPNAVLLMGIKQEYNLAFITNDSSRMIIGKNGIRYRSSATDSALVIGTDNYLYKVPVSGGGGGASWLLTGNSGTTAGTNFIGTTDAQALDFRTNNSLRLRFPAGPFQPGVSEDSVLVRNSSGVVFTRAQSDIIGVTPNLQEILTAGSTLTEDNTIDIDSYRMDFTNAQRFRILDFNSTERLRIAQSGIGVAAGTQYTTKLSSGLKSGISRYLLLSPDSTILTGIPYTLSTVGKKIMLRDTATGLLQNIDPALIGGSTPISSLTAATGTNMINNGDQMQEWQWNTLSEDYGLLLTSTSTVGVSPTLFGVEVSGVNATSSVTTQAADFANSHSGTSSTTIGIKVQASGGTNNYAIIVPTSGGSVGIGTSAPAAILHTVGTVRHATLGTASADTTTYKPVGINSSGDIIPMTYWPGSGGGGGVTWNAITNPTGAQALTIGAGNGSTWTDNQTTGTNLSITNSTLTSGGLIGLTSTSTAANNFSLLNINSSGANANSTRTARGGVISVTNTGTSSTNTALTLTASGGTTNNALIATAGNVGIGTTTPAYLLDVNGKGRFTDSITVNDGIKIKPSSGTTSILEFKSSDASNPHKIYGDATQMFIKGYSTLILGDVNGNYLQGYNGKVFISYGGGTDDARLGVNSTSTSTVALNVSGVTSQTANLQQWQATAGGTVLSAINAAGNLIIGGSTVSASAAVDITSTTKGFLTPRMTTTQKNAISSPAVGLQVYDTDLKQPQYNDGVTWKAQVGMTFGTAAPAITPAAIGNFFLDTTNKKLYISTGTSSSADWNILN